MARLHERVPTAEVNFFSIVINIHQQSGGNLSEALNNLSAGAARPRQDARQDPGDEHGGQGLRLEHRRPALRRGGITTLTSPDYISLLWTTDAGKIALVGSAIWMSLGILVIKKMIAFEI